MCNIILNPNPKSKIKKIKRKENKFCIEKQCYNRRDSYQGMQLSTCTLNKTR